MLTFTLQMSQMWVYKYMLHGLFGMFSGSTRWDSGLAKPEATCGQTPLGLDILRLALEVNSWRASYSHYGGCFP